MVTQHPDPRNELRNVCHVWSRSACLLELVFWVFVLRNFPFSPDVSCTLGGVLHLVSKGKPTENSPLAGLSGGTLGFETQSLLYSYSPTRIAVSGQSLIQLRAWDVGHWAELAADNSLVNGLYSGSA